MTQETGRELRLWRAVALLAVGVTIGVAMVATPAAGHVGGTVNHLWNHLKPKADARYARSNAENLRHVGAVGQPGFNSNSFCTWSNYDATHAQASFYKDQWGSVHLQGLVKATDGSGFGCEPASFGADQLIFTLPAGYRPARRSVYPTVTNANLGRINIDPDGGVRIDPGTGDVNANVNAWVSIQGLTFRAEAPLPAALRALKKLERTEPSRAR